jgi:hypothetical protein
LELAAKLLWDGQRLGSRKCRAAVNAEPRQPDLDKRPRHSTS